MSNVLDLQCDDRGFILDITGKPVAFSKNPRLLPSDVKIPLTQKHIEEIVKCSMDPIYFAENYAKIFSLDDGWIVPKLRSYQKRILSSLIDNRFNQIMAGRQSGKSVTTIIYILWCIIFKPDMVVGIAANKYSMASENLLRLKDMFQEVPIWLKPGVKVWNESYIILDNGSKVYVSATAKDSFRGLGIKLLFVDEVAFIDTWSEFANSVVPTISSSKYSQVIYTSTPQGLNHWFTMWKDAEDNKSTYKNVRVEWNEIPGRDEKWKEQMIASLDGGAVKFAQEFECAFLGSSDTLVDMEALMRLTPKQPIKDISFGQEIRVYEKPVENHKYILVGDGAKGAIDGFGIHVIDVTNIPFVQVLSGVIQENYLKVPQPLYNIAKSYNDAYVILEVNEGAGTSVGDLLYQMYDYSNIYRNKNKKWLGFQTSSGNRNKILSNLKLFIENNKIIIHDKLTIDELFTFVNVRGKYQAQSGKHDDTVMSLSLVFVPFLETSSYVNFDEFLSVISQNEEASQEEQKKETIQFINMGTFQDMSTSLGRASYTSYMDNDFLVEKPSKYSEYDETNGMWVCYERI